MRTSNRLVTAAVSSLLLVGSLSAAGALLETSFAYSVTSFDDGMTRGATALVTRRDDLGAERRPVILAMPGWDGVGDMPAGRDSYTTMYANSGYVVVNIGFHNTNNSAYFNSDLAESAKAALDQACGASYADCTAVVLTGISYGATQTHPVLRFLRASGVFDGSAGANGGRRVVGFLAQDAGYTLHYANPVDADATAYSIAMIENQGDGAFPIDSCEFGNCGARNRGDFHQAAAGSQYVLSYCPPGGSHGLHAGQWDAWVLSAMKTMIHNHRGVPKFGGYVEPSIAPTNACVTVPAQPPDPPRLGNISTRGQVLTGNDVMIGGFVIGGSASKTVVIRARGPSLVPFGITNAIANPQLQLVRSSDQATLATNDNWGSAGNASDLSASGFAPSDPLEAAILVSLPPGAYTAIVSGVGGGTGVAIVEVFEVDHAEVPLANISTRGQVLTGNDVVIGGFIVNGSAPQTVVVRARGPSLIPFGITNALANPQLQLVRSSDQVTIAANDDWGSASNASALAASGFAPSNPQESAILVTLPPGAYTAIVSGVGGGTGVGIVEVFAQ